MLCGLLQFNYYLLYMKAVAHLLSLLSMFSFLLHVESIYIVLSPKEKRCVYKKAKENVKYSGKYFVTGQEETANKVYISNSRKEKIWVSDNKKEGEFEIFNSTEEGYYALCFISDSSKSLTISFDIYKGNKEEALVSVQSIQELNSNIHELRKRVDIIHSDMRNSLIRRTGHLESKLQLKILLF